jgi:hypothetical protein
MEPTNILETLDGLDEKKRIALSGNYKTELHLQQWQEYQTALFANYPQLASELRRAMKELELADNRWKMAEQHHKDFHEDDYGACIS